MRQHAFRALIVAGALVALSVPALNVASDVPGVHLISSALACSIPGKSDADCSTTVPIIGVPLNSFYSPPVLSANPVVFNQTKVGGEANVAIPGSVTLTVNDLRGNNAGFAVSLAAGDNTTPNCLTGYAGNIPAADCLLQNSQPNGGGTGPGPFCKGLYGYTPVGCETITNTGLGLPAAPGLTLNIARYVAYGCPVQGHGLGLYNIPVNLLIALPADSPENIAFNGTGTWNPHFTATLTEGSSLLGGPDGATIMGGAPFNCARL
jgi:hypothetical protein